jgi:hypothetical protein
MYPGIRIESMMRIKTDCSYWHCNRCQHGFNSIGLVHKKYVLRACAIYHSQVDIYSSPQRRHELAWEMKM